MIDDHTPDPNNPGSTRKTYTFNTYDNLDDVLNVSRYYDLANTTGLPNNAPNAGDPVIGRSGAAYDNLGQQYQSIAYNQNGTIAIVSNTWYDPDGNVMMSLPGGTQEFTKTVYDGLGNATAVYDGYDPSTLAVSYAAAGSVSGDIILTQTDTQYNPAGYTIFATTIAYMTGLVQQYLAVGIDDTGWPSRSKTHGIVAFPSGMSSGTPLVFSNDHAGSLGCSTLSGQMSP
jgi:hypothetical protein